MLGIVARFLDEQRPAAEPNVVEGGPRPGLYECPGCGSVYLSEDQTTCRSCETDAEAVPTEYDLGFGSAGRGDD